MINNLTFETPESAFLTILGYVYTQDANTQGDREVFGANFAITNVERSDERYAFKKLKSYKIKATDHNKVDAYYNKIKEGLEELGGYLATKKYKRGVTFQLPDNISITLNVRERTLLGSVYIPSTSALDLPIKLVAINNLLNTYSTAFGTKLIGIQLICTIGTVYIDKKDGAKALKVLTAQGFYDEPEAEKPMTEEEFGNLLLRVTNSETGETDTKTITLDQLNLKN